MPDLGDQIEQAVTDGIQSASVDGRTASIVPVPDQIAADKHLGGKGAKSRPGRGLRFTKLLKGGNTDDRYGGSR